MIITTLSCSWAPQTSKNFGTLGFLEREGRENFGLFGRGRPNDDRSEFLPYTRAPKSHKKSVKIAALSESAHEAIGHVHRAVLEELMIRGRTLKYRAATRLRPWRWMNFETALGKKSRERRKFCCFVAPIG